MRDLARELHDWIEEQAPPIDLDALLSDLRAGRPPRDAAPATRFLQSPEEAVMDVDTTTRPRTSSRVGLVLAAATAFVVAVGLGLAWRGDPPVAPPDPVADTPVTETEVAEAFMQARADHDADAAAQWLAPDAFLLEQEHPGWQLERDQLAPYLERQRVEDYRMTGTRCRELDSPPPPEVAGAARVACTYSFESRLTRALGLDPLARGYDLEVLDGQVVRYMHHSHRLYPVVPADFGDWLDPADHDAIYTSAQGTDGTEVTVPRLTPEAIDAYDAALRRFADESS